MDSRVGWYRSDRQLVADHVGRDRARSRPVPSATSHEESRLDRPMSATATRPGSRSTLELVRGAATAPQGARDPDLFLAAAVLGLVVISVAIVLALLGRGDPRFLSKIQLGCAAGRGVVSRGPASSASPRSSPGPCSSRSIAMLVAAPLGPRRGDLPVRVRHARASGGPSSRSSRPWPASRAWSSATSRSRSSTRTSCRSCSRARRHLQPLAAGIGRRASSRPRSWPRWPRTRCTPSPTRSARRRTGSAPGSTTASLRVVFPAAVSGHRGRADPRLLARRRRDDDRGDRGRRDRQRERTLNPLDAGQTMTARDALARDRLGPGRGRPGFAFDSLFFVGLLLFALTFLLNVVADRFVRRVRSSVLMARRSPRSTPDRRHLALTRRGRRHLGGKRVPLRPARDPAAGAG